MKTIKLKRTYHIYEIKEEIEGESLTYVFATKGPRTNECLYAQAYAYTCDGEIEDLLKKKENAMEVLASKEMYYSEYGEEYTAKYISENFRRVEIDFDDLTIRSHTPNGLVQFVFFKK